MSTIKYSKIILTFSLISFFVSVQAMEVQVPVASKLYKEIVKSNDISLCDVYLSNYPDGKKIEEVKGIKETQVFINAYSAAAEDYSDTALHNYLTNYPNGQFVGKATDAIEVSAWQKAHHDNTIESYQIYLNNYPDGKAVDMAKSKIEAMK